MHDILQKLTTSEARRLARLLAQQEATVAASIQNFINQMQSDVVSRNVLRLLQSGRLEEVLAMVDAAIVPIGSSLSQVFNNVGSVEVARMIDSLSRTGVFVSASFDPSYPRAAELMRENRLRLVTELRRQQRDTLRTALVDALNSGRGTAATARTFRSSIGLTRQQLAAVSNYRRLLESGSREALDRALRDRRMDAAVARAAAQGQSLSAAQIDRMVEHYRRGMLRLRTETIARTEAHRTMAEAREEAVHQLVEQTGADPKRFRRIWRATHDKRTRDTHAAMDGQERGLDEAFESPSGALLMFPGDPDAPGAETINCRCVLELKISAPS